MDKFLCSDLLDIICLIENEVYKHTHIIIIFVTVPFIYTLLQLQFQYLHIYHLVVGTLVWICNSARDSRKGDKSVMLTGALQG